jgi:hypothetical protein
MRSDEINSKGGSRISHSGFKLKVEATDHPTHSIARAAKQAHELHKGDSAKELKETIKLLRMDTIGETAEKKATEGKGVNLKV